MQNRIGTVIREKRSEYGYSQERLAMLIGKTTGYIGQIERGEIYPSAQMLAQLVEILAIDANALFFDKREDSTVSKEIALRVSRLNPEKQEFILGVLSLLERT